MIPVISPDTKVLTKEHIEANEILIVDHMPHCDVYAESLVPADKKEEFKFFKNSIAELFWKDNIDYSKKTFYTDSYFLFDDFSNLKMYETHFFINEAKSFVRAISWESVPEFEVTHGFTFMSNKSRPHRDLCSLILKGWQKEGLNFKYSYNSGPYSFIIAKDLLADNKLPNDSLLDDTFFGDSKNYKKWPAGGFHTQSQNAYTFKFLFPHIFENCAVGIVTEPNFYERGNMFSEKTIMSVYSGQFLIWPGSYKMAETAKKLGFDIFDDIIDHSYQYIEDPSKRVIDAFLKNKTLLSNINLLKKLRKENISRLNANLKLMRNIEFLRNSLNNLHHK